MNKLVENLDRLTDFALEVNNVKTGLEFCECPQCKRTFTDPQDVEFIQEYGRCIMCDQLSAEIMAEGGEPEEDR